MNMNMDISIIIIIILMIYIYTYSMSSLKYPISNVHVDWIKLKNKIPLPFCKQPHKITQLSCNIVENLSV